MISRVAIQIVSGKMERYPVVAILGPRQAGKTTLARQIALKHKECHYFDLEKPRDLSRLNEPELTLEYLSGLVVIDEIQRKPDLFPLLRVLADRTPRPANFLILGSASPHLVKDASESLTGRIGFVHLSGFTVQELGKEALLPLWVRGGLPRSYLATTDAVSLEWREDYITSLLERDVPQLGISIPAATLRRFWNMLAHYHGQIWNGAEMAAAMGVAQLTVRRYLDLLGGMFLIRQLPPWFENIAKRQVKSPKIYFRDSGLLHYFLTIGSFSALQGHPKLGASWEGFALEQTLTMLQYPEAYFWATHSGAELDLMISRGGERYGFEFKYTDTPRWSRSLENALHDLSLKRVFVITPGQERFPIHESGEAAPLHSIPDLLPSVTGNQGQT
jgi:predicted AAA+ superfamily ATPase